MNNINIKLSSNTASLPTKGTDFSAGYDLYSSEELIIKPQNRSIVKTGISLEIPKGYYGRIAPRSGLAFKYGINVLAGVIDNDYRGEIGVILHNTDLNNDFPIKIGDRIAQIIFERCYDFPFIKISEFLNYTNRGDSGFGSTGT